jgi:hypothetical protein
MKKLYILFFLTVGFLADAQIVNIPDANFKARLVAANGGLSASTQMPVYNTSTQYWGVTSNDIIDTNGDGEIQLSEAQAIKYLSITSSASPLYGISDLTGIESFTNLVYLESKCYLNSIDLTQNSALQGLDLHDGAFYNNLNLSQNINLVTLRCASNVLTNLDLTNNTNLEYLDSSSNLLTNLDLSQNVHLKYLLTHVNQLTNLNISGLTDLKRLIVFNNNLVNLNLSNLSSLEDIMCGSNQLGTLNLSDLINLKYIDCQLNFLTDLDFSQNNNVYSILCTFNQIDDLNLTGLVNLEKLNCSNNLLTTLDVSELYSLDDLWCNDNQLTWLNAKNGTESWETLYFAENPNLNYICVDEEVVEYIQWLLSFEETQNCHVNSYCSFTPGGTFYDISGTTKFDSNNDGCDVSDLNYSNLNFSITDGTNTGSFIANTSGTYFMPVLEGSHTVTPNLENPSYFNISPTSFIVDFPTQASPFTQDFCVSANGVHSDVEIVLIPTTAARPGFDSTYKLVYHNKGNQVENGSVVFSMHNQTVVDFVSSVPNFDSQTVTSIVEKFTWNYSNLLPFETREIEIVVNLNSPLETPALNAGDLLSFDAQILITNTDEYIIDNFFAIRQEVVNSFDPNDKTCLQGETIEPSEVGNYVHYVIRFENTGTFAAENIVVRDMIDLDKFDISTLVPLHSSHDFSTRINGDRVEFIFENINLDFNDATNDGYVVFKIKTKSTLVVGNTFSNNVNIYFDYNFPITTNTYTTAVQTLSTQDFDFGTYFTLYPNPTNEVLNIKAKQELNLNSIEIYNQLGQIVMVVTNAVHAIDVSNLASGTYFVKINTEKGNATTKFVKQ